MISAICKPSALHVTSGKNTTLILGSSVTSISKTHLLPVNHLMWKTSNRDSKSGASYPTLQQSNSSPSESTSRPFPSFLRASLTRLLGLLVVIVLLISAFPWLYEIKTKAGIDIVPGIHTGPVLEKYSGRIVKCEWLYPYHCPRHSA